MVGCGKGAEDESFESPTVVALPSHIQNNAHMQHRAGLLVGFGATLGGRRHANHGRLAEGDIARQPHLDQVTEGG